MATNKGRASFSACLEESCAHTLLLLLVVVMLTQVLEMDQRDRLRIAAAAQRRAATLFSGERFEAGFLAAMAPLLPAVNEAAQRRCSGNQ